MDTTILTGLARLEALLLNDGPKVASAIGTVGDALAGTNDSPLIPTSIIGETSQQHLGQRLHNVAATLEGLLSFLGVHAQRAGAVVGTQG